MFIFDRGCWNWKNFYIETHNSRIITIINRDISFNLTKTKALFMASTGKITFNINDLIIHSTLNIHVQQSLFSLPNYHQIH